MKYEEEIFIKLAETKTLNEEEFLECACKILNLDFVIENSNYLISSDDFVIEIEKEGKISLLFVEKELNLKNFCIGEYLSHFYSNKKVFYCLLRFFVNGIMNFLNKKEVISCENDCKIVENSYCSCILSKNYCKTLGETNFFTHDQFQVQFGDNFIIPNISQVKKEKSDQSNKNVAEILSDKNVCYNSLNKIGSGFYYKKDEIRIKNGEIYINDIKSAFYSFIYRKNLNLQEIKDLMNKQN
ncbi:hypothetical protein NUSPORA_01269 [Nucleospora cyclopteri]